MNTTAAIFFLILGQAPDGFHATGSSMAVAPSHYISIAECEDAGEFAREHNQGLAFLSYTCVPGEVNLPPKLIDSASKDGLPELHKAFNPPAGRAKCDEVCELIEAAKP